MSWTAFTRPPGGLAGSDSQLQGARSALGMPVEILPVAYRYLFDALAAVPYVVG
jgi:hypothetical protein